MRGLSSLKGRSPKEYRNVKFEGQRGPGKQGGPGQAVQGRQQEAAAAYPLSEGQVGQSPRSAEGRAKDLANLGDLVMKEFYKPVVVNIGGKTVKKSQAEILAHQMVKNAITKGSVATKLVLQCLEQYEARLAKLEEAKAMKQADGSVEIDWDAEKEQLYRELMAAAGKTPRK
jgi:Family of unknown function (DUF5681)